MPFVNHANEQLTIAQESEIFSNLRVSYITTEDDIGEKTTSSAIGGKLGYVSATWQGLSAGGTLYTSQKLFKDENSDFFGSDGKGYFILGEAFLQLSYGQTEIKAGRFEFDSPHADTDDIRMVPNTFSGVLLRNTNIPDTTLYASYLDQWSGVDSPVPEKFTDLNGDNGIYSVGAIYEGIEHLNVQGWFYHGQELTQLAYIEVMYEKENIVLGAQLGSQVDKNNGVVDSDGDIFGVTASYRLYDFIFTSSYNKAFGTVTNGFGGGPFFTSAGDHTIADIEDQKAFSLGINYFPTDELAFSVLHVDFEKGANETDFIIAYEFTNNMNIEATYHQLYGDGDILLINFNASF